MGFKFGGGLPSHVFSYLFIASVAPLRTHRKTKRGELSRPKVTCNALNWQQRCRCARLAGRRLLRDMK